MDGLEIFDPENKNSKMLDPINLEFEDDINSIEISDDAFLTIQTNGSIYKYTISDEVSLPLTHALQ